MKIIFKTLSILLFLSLIGSCLFWYFAGPVDKDKKEVVYVIPQNVASFNLSESLYEQGLIKNKKAFDFIKNNFYKNMEIKPGGYRLSSSKTTLQIMDNLKDKQDLFWVNIFFCPRKEQVGEKLASTLGWSDKQLTEWNNLYKDKSTEYFEGVYYPDTYLIPADESVKNVAQRFINRFNEKFDPLEREYQEKNIRWTTGLKIASLIAREAGGRDDMKLISGVIWNRLDQDIRLQIDATMQYTLGKNENGSWWGSIDLEEKQNDSPYNSYLNKGLPPTPICSPNIDAIEAALNPEETDCIFYLHDSNRQIHCAKTYEEHKENIQKYL